MLYLTFGSKRLQYYDWYDYTKIRENVNIEIAMLFYSDIRSVHLMWNISKVANTLKNYHNLVGC